MYLEALKFLAEPGTGAPLELQAAEYHGESIVGGRLHSTATERVYPIVRGIPRFVDGDGYTASFGMQWNRFREVQVDSETRAGLSRRRFLDETRWTREDLADSWVFDGGCGAGRFAEVAADLGANVIALDLSSAVEAAAETCARFPNVTVVQGSVLEPPIKRGSMDYAYSIGVIQHTPDPELAIECVVDTVRDGGGFALTIYGRRPWTKLHVKYLLRPLTKRLPEETLLKAVERAMPVLFPLSDVLYRVPVLGHAARFVLPVTNWVEHDEYSREQRYAEAVLDTFDALSPAHDHPMSWTEADAVLRRVLGREGAWSFSSRTPVVLSGVARRPAAHTAARA